jgi:hypothetical protein
MTQKLISTISFLHSGATPKPVVVANTNPPRLTQHPLAPSPSEISSSSSSEDGGAATNKRLVSLKNYVSHIFPPSSSDRFFVVVVVAAYFVDKNKHLLGKTNRYQTNRANLLFLLNRRR